MEQLENRLVSFISSNLDLNLLLTLNENIREAYKQAHEDASKLVNINYSRIRSQSRRYYLDNAIAGVYSNAQPTTHYTDPKGEIYVTLTLGQITLSHIELHNNEIARPAKHRKSLAKKKE